MLRSPICEGSDGAPKYTRKQDGPDGGADLCGLDDFDGPLSFLFALQIDNTTAKCCASVSTLCDNGHPKAFCVWLSIHKARTEKTYRNDDAAYITYKPPERTTLPRYSLL